MKESVGQRIFMPLCSKFAAQADLLFAKKKYLMRVIQRKVRGTIHRHLDAKSCNSQAKRRPEK